MLLGSNTSLKYGSSPLPTFCFTPSISTYSGVSVSFSVLRAEPAVLPLSIKMSFFTRSGRLMVM